MDNKREEEVKIEDEMTEGMIRREREERKEKIKTSRMKSKERRLLARYRCGNEMNARKYWKEEKERNCRVCNETEENLWHVLRECRETKIEKGIEEALEEGGEGLEILKDIEKIRANKMGI
ncbi:hypothetical protein PV328_012222 [Microctonus aethiopoides]|uniref:Uncharacterized protein n=1 Tax=Microctonus aethiopoides TaxID=144406 RepID=A0AA39FGT0_9HYME|nr:hypothetical protein PV328_012222 [Microctonus aethiopoides]